MLEQIVEVREGPRDVSFDQVLGLAWVLLAIGCGGRIHEIFVVLVERTGHSRLVADEERPCLPAHCQGYSTVLNVMTHLLLCLGRAWHANITFGFFLEQGKIEFHPSVVIVLRYSLAEVVIIGTGSFLWG